MAGSALMPPSCSAGRYSADSAQPWPTSLPAGPQAWGLGNFSHRGHGHPRDHSRAWVTPRLPHAQWHLLWAKCDEPKTVWAGRIESHESSRLAQEGQGPGPGDRHLPGEEQRLRVLDHSGDRRDGKVHSLLTQTSQMAATSSWPEDSRKGSHWQPWRWRGRGVGSVALPTPQFRTTGLQSLERTNIPCC